MSQNGGFVVGNVDVIAAYYSSIVSHKLIISASVSTSLSFS